MSRLHLNGNLFLAPMARITDIAFRSVCVNYGADVTCTELISADGLMKGNQKTEQLCQRAKNEKQFAVQLFGSDPRIMADAARKVADHCTMIDINMGCPVPNICANGAGSALLANQKNAQAIVERMTEEVETPITVKMRLGLSKSHQPYLSFAKALEQAGASLLTVHGRTKDQGYSGTANWNAIQEIKKEVSIPVIGNGDIRTPEHATQRLEETNVDGIAIGRGASGNPCIFSQTKQMLTTRTYVQTTNEMRIQAFIEYMDIANHWQTNFLHQKMQAQEFTKGIEGASLIRKKLNDAKTIADLRQIVTTYIRGMSEHEDQ